MALKFIPSSGLSFCSRSKPNHLHKLSPTLFPTLATKYLRNPTMKKAMATTSVEGVPRRTGNHHPNLWDDDFIQSLPKLPYDAPEYHERADRLVGEVKEMFNELGAADSSSQNVYKRLELVNSVEILGIGQHFRKEIVETLDYVYRFWNEMIKDLNTAALGLRVLRLHRYPVSSDVLEQFKGKDGRFLCSTDQLEEEIKSIINLFRASWIAFPGETIMDEAKDFSTMYLNKILEKSDVFSANLLQEITYNLEYGWYSNLPRLEAWNYIHIYGQSSSWLKNMDNKTILYLARLDFNIMQSLYRAELQMISRWWKESELCKLDFFRHRHIEYYFSGCAISAEPKHSAFRIALTKMFTITTCIDDIYDTYGTLEELQIFTEVFKRWEVPPIDRLPEYMKIAYCGLYETINECAKGADEIQGRDTLPHAQKAWDDYLNAMLEEVKWLANQYVPNLKTFLENGKESSAARASTLQSLLTLDVISEDALQQVDYPSKFNDLLGLTFRLLGDIRTFKAEANRGEVNSSITSYIRDHPLSNENDALKYLNCMLDERLKELNMEYLKSDGVPTCIKDFAYDISRCFHVFYKERDGFSISTKDMKNHVKQILIEPIEM